MRKLLLLFIVIPCFSFSQEEKQYTREDSLKYTYFAIKSPLPSLLDPVISSVPLFFEYRHEQKYAIEAGYFFLIPQIFPHTEGKEDEKLTKFKAEVKRYYNDEFYVGVEYGFVKYQYNFRDDYFVNIADSKVYKYEFATIDKQVHIFNVKVGVEYIGRRNPRFIYDIFVGVGGRIVNLDYNNLINAFEAPAGDLVAAGLNKNAKYDISELNGYRGNFTMGFKVGYKLWSRF